MMAACGVLSKPNGGGERGVERGVELSCHANPPLKGGERGVGEEFGSPVCSVHFTPHTQPLVLPSQCTPCTPHFSPPDVPLDVPPCIPPSRPMTQPW